MAIEDRVGGKMKQARGKGNDTMGAMKGDTSQQVKGKIQKAVGKVQDKMGKADSKMSRSSNRGRDAR